MGPVSDGIVGVKQSATPDRKIDNEVLVIGGNTVYRQRVSDPETQALLASLQAAVQGTLQVAATGAVALDAPTIAALQAVHAVVSGTVAVSNFPSTQNVVGTVALDSATLTALHSVAAVVSGTVALDATTLAALESITATIANTVTVAGTVELGSTTLAALEQINAVLQVGGVNVDNAHPVPVSDAGGSLTVDGTVAISNPTANPETGLAKDATLTARLPAALDADGGVKTHVQNTVPVTGPLTDTQLRATPVVVTGTVTATLGEIEVKNDAGNPIPVSGTVAVSGTVPVSGPLTDAQLRAAGVPVDASGHTVPISAATLPLPAGASQDGTDGTGIAAPSGGVGIRGWLSGIYQKLSGTIATSRTWTLGSGTDSVNVGNFPAEVEVKNDSGNPLAVSGTVTATGPLTDTQLRATAVPVSAASLPLPTGAAADGTDGTGIVAPTGGVGIRGWLSGIYNKLSGTLTTNATVVNFPATQPVSGTVAVSSLPEVEIKNDTGNLIKTHVENSAFGSYATGFAREEVGVRSVLAGVPFGGLGLVNAMLPGHAVDTANSSSTGLTNGTTTAFTVDTVTNELISVAHGLVVGNAVVLKTTGTLPTPLKDVTVGTTAPNIGVITEVVYWVASVTTDRFTLTAEITATSPVVVDITDVGTGSFTYQKRGQFIGTFVDYSQVGHGLDFFLDLERPGLLRTEWSADGVTVGSPVGSLFATAARPITATPVAGFGTFYINLVVLQTMVAKYRRVRWVNGPNPQTPGLFALASFIGKNNYPGSFGGLNDALSQLSTALLTRAVQAGTNPDGLFANAAIQGRHSANCTDVPLNGNTGGSDHIFRGTWFQWQGSFVGMIVDAIADVAGTLYIDFSEKLAPADGVETDVDQSITVDYVPTLNLYRRTVPVQSRWVRIRYVNGIDGQSRLDLDTAFLTAANVAPTAGLRNIPKNTDLAVMGQNVTLVEKAETPNEFVRVTGTAAGAKRSLDVNITGQEEGLTLKPQPSLVTGQGDVNGTATTAYPVTPLSQRATIRYSNPHATVDAYFSEDSAKFATSAADVLMARSSVEIDLDAGATVYWKLAAVGGSSSTGTRNGTATTAVTAVTSPNNILTSDDTRALLTGLTSAVEVTGVSTPGTGSALGEVRLQLEGRKSSVATRTVTHVATVTGTAANVTSVVSASATAVAADTYLVAVSRRNAAAAVSSLTGMGATWVQVDDVTGFGSTSRISLWRNTTPVTTTGAVTANFSTAATNSVISVSEFTNVDPTIFDNHATLASVSSNNAYSGSISGTANGMAVTFVAEVNAHDVPGNSFVEQADVVSGQAGLDVATLSLGSTGSQAYSGALSANAGWSLVAVTLKPAVTADPIVRVRYQVGANPIGATTLSATLTSNADTLFEASVLADRTWTFSDVNSMVLYVDVLAWGDANAEIDRVGILTTETTGADSVRLCFSQVGGAVA